jgi:predicted transposase/invertase (TIGR01784 family)
LAEKKLISRAERNRADIEDSKLYYTNRGIEQGIEQGKILIIDNRIKLGFSADDIARATGVQVDNIEKLAK